MNSEEKDVTRPNPSLLLSQLINPSIWNMLSFLPPTGARRVVATLLEEVNKVMMPPEIQEKYNRKILTNLKTLGVPAEPGAEQETLEKHHRLQALRQAEELLMFYGDIPQMARWVEKNATVTGLEHAEKCVSQETGCVVISAHLGPMIYYIPGLPFFLSKKGSCPDITFVMNLPNRDLDETLKKRFKEFQAFHSGTITPLTKIPGQEADLGPQLDKLLEQKKWVFMQMDAVSGGRSKKKLPFGSCSLRLPGIWGALRLAIRHRVPVLPVVAWRNEQECISFAIEPALCARESAYSSKETLEQETEKLARELAICLSKWVLADPADWGTLPKLDGLL